MKRFRVSLGDGHILRLYYPTLEAVQRSYPDAEITEDNDQSHVAHIQQMLDGAADCQTAKRNGSIVYLLRFELPIGTCWAMLSKDSGDDVWYDLCKYQLWKSGAVVVPVLKTLCTPAEFCKDFLGPKAEYAVLCMGKKSEVKKPEALKGVVKFASVSFAGMCQCQLFLNGQDLYIRHGDYFSPELYNPEDFGTPLLYRLDKYGIPHEKREKFVYADCWGAIVLRRVAWIRISNFVSLAHHLNSAEIAKTVWPMIREYHKWPVHEFNIECERFLENVAKATQEHLS